MGLVSDGGVHGHIAHIAAAAKVIRAAGVPVVLHAITDGRDVAPRSARSHLANLIEALPEDVRIVTVTGRYFAMDRDNRWSRVQEAYEAMVAGRGMRAGDARTAVTNAYARSESDEFIAATVIGDYKGVAPGDGLFCLNFRADRAREILQAMADPDFDAFERIVVPDWAATLGMVAYSEAHEAWFDTVFPPARHRQHARGVGGASRAAAVSPRRDREIPACDVLSEWRQGTPRGGRGALHGPSPDVATYDMQPEMSAGEVTDQLVGAIRDGYDLIVVNYANPDMVGHTGDLKAAIAACEAVDAGLGRALEALEAAGGAMIVTADHGNCEVMVDPETGGPHTAHTLNPVPVILVGGHRRARGCGMAAGLRIWRRRCWR